MISSSNNGYKKKKKTAPTVNGLLREGKLWKASLNIILNDEAAKHTMIRDNTKTKWVVLLRTLKGST